METRPLGPSGPPVYPVGLGAMPLSIHGRPPEAEAIRVLLAAFAAGMNLVDTADAYCLDDRDVGHNERLIARALREWRGGPVVVATKGACIRPGGAWRVNGHPDHLKGACDASLHALGVEAIDLYQLHAPDDRVPFADSVGALAELCAAWGCPTCRPHRSGRRRRSSPSPRCRTGAARFIALCGATASSLTAGARASPFSPMDRWGATAARGARRMIPPSTPSPAATASHLSRSPSPGFWPSPR